MIVIATDSKIMLYQLKSKQITLVHEFAQTLVTSSALSDDATVLAYAVSRKVIFFDTIKLRSLREIMLNCEVVEI